MIFVYTKSAFVVIYPKTKMRSREFFFPENSLLTLLMHQAARVKILQTPSERYIHIFIKYS